MTASASPITIIPNPMVVLLRDGNPKRRNAYVLPELGKLADLSLLYLQQWAKLIQPYLNNQQKTLIIGLAESSLVPAYWLAQQFAELTELCLTTRYPKTNQSIRFKEPHSHGPNHSMDLNPLQHWQQAIIIEDEITTGTTLINLIESLQTQIDQFIVCSLVDLRTIKPNRLDHLATTIIPLLTTTQLNSKQTNNKQQQIIYAIGETIIPALDYYQQLNYQPGFRHISRSPWLVDHQHIVQRIDLGLDQHNIAYFFYNPNINHHCSLQQVDIFYNSITQPIANRLVTWLQQIKPNIKTILHHSD